MRFILITSSFFILICSMVISFSHTLDFFHDAGYQGIFAILAVAAVEVAFLSFALALLTSRVRGVKPGWSTVLGCLVCTVFITWTNIRNGIGLGIEGIMAGIIVPFLLVIVEATLSKELSSKSKHEQPAQTEQPEQNGEQAEQPRSEQHNKKAEQAEQAAQEQVEQEQHKPEQPAQKKPVQKSNHVQLDFIDNGFGKVAKENYEKIRRAALNYMAEHGRLPGRPTLMKLTGCPQRQVDAVKKELEAELKTA